MRLFFLLTLTSLLISCGHLPPYPGYKVAPDGILFSHLDGKKYKKSISLGDIKSSTNSILAPPSEGAFEISEETFRQALGYSIGKAGWECQSGEKCRYVLEAELLDIHLPIFDINYTATSKASYKLISTRTKNVIFEETVSVPCTVRFFDVMNGQERLSRAAACSVRENVAHFLQVLSK